MKQIQYNGKMLKIKYTTAKVKVFSPNADMEEFRTGVELGCNAPLSKVFGWSFITDMEGFRCFLDPATEYAPLGLIFEKKTDISVEIEGRGEDYYGVKGLLITKNAIQLDMDDHSVSRPLMIIPQPLPPDVVPVLPVRESVEASSLQACAVPQTPAAQTNVPVRSGGLLTSRVPQMVAPPAPKKADETKQLRERLSKVERERDEAVRAVHDAEARLDTALAELDALRARCELLTLDEDATRVRMESYRADVVALRSSAVLNAAHSVDGMMDQCDQLLSLAADQLRLLIEHRERYSAAVKDAIQDGSGKIKEVTSVG